MVLSSLLPVVSETAKEDEKKKQAAELEKWTDNDFLCKNYIINGLSDDLYNYYNEEKKSAKDIWEALQKKYDIEEAGAKKIRRESLSQVSNDRR